MGSTLGDVLESLPEDRRDAARSALAASFGSAPVGALQPIIGGASGALIYRVEVGERHYVLRLEPMRIALHDRQRGHACMCAGAEASVAPAVHYADPQAGVAVMDFVTGRPLSEHPGGKEGLARELGEMIARVHAAAPFPKLGDYPDMIARMLGYVRGSTLLAPGLLDAHAEGLLRIREAYRWESSRLVSSHNDPNPRNILFDGKRLWLVDWELAFLNDPMVDVAILSTDFATTRELEDVLLAARFGRRPDLVMQAQLHVVRQLTRLFYGCIILSLFTASPRPAPDASLAAPSVEEFVAMFADGRLKPGGRETLYVVAKMNLAGFLAGLQAPGFEETLAMVRQG
jgi:aminoglycoside phosphotransferase (APT) family kinase protein